jgi:N utilization substance protein A
MEDQLSLAIGRDGQNARLAAKLTGWRIDIKSVVEAAGDTIAKLQSDPELAAALPAAVESIPQVQEALTKKAENRPLTPEEYTLLGQFVDRVERRTSQIKEEAVRADEERLSAARADVPPAAFTMPLDQLGLKEHVFNILIEAGYENIGNLMMSLRLDENKVLGLPGVGPKAIQNIHEQLAVMTFPEAPAEVKAEPVVVEEVPAEQVIEPIAVEELPAMEKQAKVQKETEEVEEENAKDGVSLDELFKMKPDIFQSTNTTDEDEAAKKKGKKQKKKGVELVLDEELGEVVGRKKHKRGEDDLGVEE